MINNRSQYFSLIPALMAIMVFALLSLSGCTSEHKRVTDSFDAHMSEANNALDSVRPSEQIRSSLVVENKPWFGHQAVRMRNGDPLPSRLLNSDSIVMTFERPLTMAELARQVQVATGLRVVVTGGGFAGQQSSSSGEGEEARTFLPIDGVEVAGGRVLWQGSLEKLLNQVSDLYDVDWSFENGIVRISPFVTRTFMLHALAGSVSSVGSVETGSTSEAGNLPSQEVSTTAELEIWDEVEETVTTILGDRGAATFSSSTGTITVTGLPSAVREAEEYLRYQNRMRLRRVAITARVLSIQTENSNDVGFDLQAALERGIGNQPLYLAGGASGVSAAVVRDFPSGGALDLTTGGQPKDSVQGVIEALAISGKISIVHTGTVITLSDQPAPLQVARQRTYIARTSASASGDSSSSSLEPGTVEEGLTMNVLPRVIEKNRVLLRVGLGITQIRDIVDFTSGDLTIQLPDLDTTGFLQNIVLSGGETLVMSGFERDRSTRNKAGTGSPSFMWFGGEDDTERGRNVTVLLLTADILPEDPFGVMR